MARKKAQTQATSTNKSKATSAAKTQESETMKNQTDDQPVKGQPASQPVSDDQPVESHEIQTDDQPVSDDSARQPAPNPTPEVEPATPAWKEQWGNMTDDEEEQKSLYSFFHGKGAKIDVTPAYLKSLIAEFERATDTVAKPEAMTALESEIDELEKQYNALLDGTDETTKNLPDAMRAVLASGFQTEIAQRAAKLATFPDPTEQTWQYRVVHPLALRFFNKKQFKPSASGGKSGGGSKSKRWLSEIHAFDYRGNEGGRIVGGHKLPNGAIGYIIGCDNPTIKEIGLSVPSDQFAVFNEFGTHVGNVTRPTYGNQLLAKAIHALCPESTELDHLTKLFGAKGTAYFTVGEVDASDETRAKMLTSPPAFNAGMITKGQNNEQDKVGDKAITEDNKPAK